MPLSFSLTYAPPEMIAAFDAGERSTAVSGATDMWALGVIAYELLTCKRAFPKALKQDQVCGLRGVVPPAATRVAPATDRRVVSRREQGLGARSAQNRALLDPRIVVFCRCARRWSAPSRFRGRSTTSARRRRALHAVMCDCSVYTLVLISSHELRGLQLQVAVILRSSCVLSTALAALRLAWR